MVNVIFNEQPKEEFAPKNMVCESLLEKEIERLIQLGRIGALDVYEKVYLATLERELLIIKHLGTTAISSTGMTISEWEKNLKNAKVYVIDKDYMEELLQAKTKIDELKGIINI